METIYIRSRNVSIITVDGYRMSVKQVLVRKESTFINLQDWEPPTDLDDIEIVLVRNRFCSKQIQLPANVKRAILHFLQHYHAKQDISFDCYAFANLVKGVSAHKVAFMLKYWNKQPKPWFISPGSIVFFESSKNRFHHAAVYLGHGLYLSVWGAGEDLEVATLQSMKSDYGAERVTLAEPR